ncbi:hypothetical protein [Brunnivagina elsteri]|uniref:Uncharacterized protein n=1 Tax=Brunnivagina elsteri CCALA 953 TaxID=987040 RepID=A0A2A2TIS7_9CYAN|nr:hypothetical protein [Calothrix elsteri]PAX53604.1 hypothetical protein CK510_13415 [Calothrix elsteri CCALA 953]
MLEAVNCSTITDYGDLQYISDIVSQVLDNKRELSSIKDVQRALKELSLERGREIQMNLVFEEDKLTGFNFSFKASSSQTTATISFKQQIDIKSGRGDLVTPPNQTNALDIFLTIKKGNISIPSSCTGEITVLQEPKVLDEQIISPDVSEITTSISPRLTKTNPGLTGVAHQLVSQNEINGLWLAGLSLKSGTYLISNLSKEDKFDIHTAGIELIKRFQKILPEEFVALKARGRPKNIEWKDPKSNKKYQFYFNFSEMNLFGDITKHTSLKGFELTSNSNSMKPVFIAKLVDEKYNHWSIEKCDFTKKQIQSLSFATKSTLSNCSTALNHAVDGFSYQ